MDFDFNGMNMDSVEEFDGLSMLVPVYNEIKSVKQVLNNLLDVLNRLGIPAELIVINDGSSDGTEKILEIYSNRIKIITHQENKGYGAALKTGIRQAYYSIIAMIDADETYPNKDLPKLFEQIKTCDMVVGARTGRDVNIPLLRRPAKWLLNKLANYLVETKIPDLNSGFRIFRKEIVENYLHILPNRFSFTTTLTLAMIADGYQVKYEPINYYKREGTSKIKPVDALGFVILIIRTITYFNPLRFFLPFSLFLFGIGYFRLCYDIFWLQNLTDSTTLLFLFALQTGLIGIVADLIVRRNGILR